MADVAAFKEQVNQGCQFKGEHFQLGIAMLDGQAVEGGYVYEPPGETHTLVVPEDVPEMITLFHITGAMIYVVTAEIIPETREKSKGEGSMIGLMIGLVGMMFLDIALV